MNPEPSAGEGKYIALIGDIVRSRQLTPDARAHLQRDLEELMDVLNTRFKDALASRFTVTLGDEFQALMAKAEVVPDVLQILESALRPIPVRVGVGYGTLTTPIKPNSIGMDGPAFHNARDAISRARKLKMLGGVFAGFGESHDKILNGYARILWYHRSRWSELQLEVTNQLREGRSQTEIAHTLGVTRQAIHARVTAAGWDSYQAATYGWVAALSLVNT